ncbi:MAG: hypothetical protein CR217_11025 [Beijerinckiaceae bacterium]|nr:MAG: hypothetical protein CR217_11025 [Beijerinckiaceae bacterium]
MTSATEGLRSIPNSKRASVPNPRGRGKRGHLQIGEIMKRVLSATTEFRDRGTVKKASRLELSVRRLAASAAKGDIGSAAWLLKLRTHAEKYRDAGPTIIRIIGGLPPSDLLSANAGTDEIDES